MRTTIKTLSGSATDLSMIADETVDLVVTSPPYPMIKMWDDVFISMDSSIRSALEHDEGLSAFERMHQILDAVWEEVFRVLEPGGIICVNIGDATRTIHGEYRLYSNHARILTTFMRLGFVTLPDILWRKPTNAPNKFMGSGMLPAGAYVTYEHEYILVARKGARRIFQTKDEKQVRRQSAFFWEERNHWFSDVWTDLRGTKQKLQNKDIQRRSAAFPLELAYRLINMFSVKQDIVLDPFLGTGTTLAAATASGRHGLGVEIDEQFFNTACELPQAGIETFNQYNMERLNRHVSFIAQRIQEGKSTKHTNTHYGFPVVTKQETELIIHELTSIECKNRGEFDVIYSNEPQRGYSKKWPGGNSDEDKVDSDSNWSKEEVIYSSSSEKIPPQTQLPL